MIIGTAVNASGLAQALLMARSVKRQMPWARVALCLVEEFPAQPLPDIDWIFTAREISDRLGLPDFESHMFKFNSLQCGVAMKGRMLAYLLDTFPSEQHVVYLDPEMYVLQPFHEIGHMLENYDVVLTPHHLEPSSARESSREIGTLTDGTFHSGLVAVKNSPEGHHFAKWWMKIAAGEYEGQPSGLFKDQPYLNFAPAYFNAGVLRHPGYNLAFWNLHENGRKVFREERGFVLTDQAPLCCVNFSNFLGLLESGMNQHVHRDGALRQLWSEYQGELSRNRSEYPSLQWSYNFFYSGETISDETRLRFKAASSIGKPSGNPFSLSNHSGF
ncbi:hypothetical protein KIH86_08045 [Paenibacillus sp. HN-1]|uniref:hypothetical protein n=1 Tax=Paenibacillus TaxID=44249 RepID=UPI001CA902CF|nr:MULTISPECIES: hypothetical protein [Paenibacillus]MBY9078654.1 hypothetical protein [Paenibacillus sp. CGMCC 1.18879]MBY9084190.1 hypothetical protein [Paenibacillus sinensis]